jgi:hypothetical protein
MVYLQIASSVVALVISCGALAVSVLAYRQARNMTLLSTRREAINHVRVAIWDVKINGNITAETVASIRDALHLSTLVFSSAVRSVLEQTHGIAFRLQHKPFERQTDKDDTDTDLMADQLDSVLKVMIKEAALGK